MMIVRAETSADIPHIAQVNRDAFGQPDEANLVNALRDNGNALISLVAVVDNCLVGHIMVSPVSIVDSNTTWSAVAIAPVAVTPTFQQRGIGSQLVRAALAQCQANGHPVVFLLGHPSYYPRFGFIPAQPLGIRPTFNVSIEAFMVIELQPNALQGRRGVLHYAAEFNVL